jgi:hypothetical protein
MSSVVCGRADKSFSSCVTLGSEKREIGSLDIRRSDVAVLSPNLISGRQLLEAGSQRDISLFHVIPKFLPFETGDRWLGEVAPGAPQPFLQRTYILVQRVGHRPTIFAVTSGAAFTRFAGPLHVVGERSQTAGEPALLAPARASWAGADQKKTPL